MQLPKSRSLVPGLVHLAEVDSTNDELVRLASGPAAADWPDLSGIVTGNQTRGRGRHGREWLAADSSLAASILLRPVDGTGSPLPVDQFTWYPLIAGLAMTRAVALLVDGDIGLKWPNDVLIGEEKVSGILCELLPDAAGIVIGAGVNLDRAPDGLPGQVTSLAEAGAVETSFDTVLATYLAELINLSTAYSARGGDAEASGIRVAVEDACDSLGREVRVHLPGGADLTGLAAGIDEFGQIVIKRASDGELVAVGAGDVTHLRY